MSKEMKRLQMDAIRNTFEGVRDMVVLRINGLDVQDDNASRLALRKKDIRLHTVKNSLARRVFGEIGIKLDGVWEGPTTIAWGSESLADLSKELDDMFKKNKNVEFKGAVVEGEQISFEQALKMPTREEALRKALGVLIGPASTVLAQITSPGAKFASQMKSKAEESGDAEQSA